MFKPDDLLVEHGRGGTFFHLLRVIRKLHILGLNNDVVMLVELIFEIASDSPNRHLGLRSTLDQLPLNTASIAISAQLTRSLLLLRTYPLLSELLHRRFRGKSILVFQ